VLFNHIDLLPNSRMEERCNLLSDADWYKNVRNITKNAMGEEGIDVVFEHI
jgi:hypothetical protein